MTTSGACEKEVYKRLRRLFYAGSFLFHTGMYELVGPWSDLPLILPERHLKVVGRADDFHMNKVGLLVLS
jgi:hypothetical protein